MTGSATDLASAGIYQQLDLQAVGSPGENTGLVISPGRITPYPLRVNTCHTGHGLCWDYRAVITSSEARGMGGAGWNKDGSAG